MKSNIIIAGFMIVAMIVMSKYYSGLVIAKLPFQPFWLVKGISHRGLEGSDLTDCSFVFIYVLVGMIFRQNV